MSSSSPEVAPTRRQLLSSRVFECTVLPPKSSFKGTVMPRILMKGRRRLVCLEVHAVQQRSTRLEECVVRVMVPDKKRKHDEDDDYDDEDEASVAPTVFKDSTIVEAHNLDGWRAKYKFPIQAVSIAGVSKSTVFCKLGLGSNKQTRDIIFDSVSDAEEFENLIKGEQQSENQRTKSRISAVTDVDGSTSLDLLVEIVSGRDLPAADITSSDPFCTAEFNGTEVHRTDYLSKTLDPIWTISSGSLFCFSTTVSELFRGQGLVITVLDYDTLGGNDKLGMICIAPKDVYAGTGDRVEYKLEPPVGQKKKVPGYLAVRIRRATDYDKEFMESYKNSKKSLVSVNIPGFKKKPKDETASKGGSSNLKSYITRRSRIIKEGPNAGQREYKVRPSPDPNNEAATTWMTEPAIEAAITEPSKTWIDAGTGRLGRLFVEILACDGLPNLDSGGFAGNKTDAFVSLVFEDATATTDVIDDCLAPRWLPWTKRAFEFHMFHSSSQLFLGVFDYDEGINPTDDHDLIGRVSVDISQLHKNTVYTLTHNIYTTARMTTRKCKGTITIRLRMEIDDERKLLVSTLEPPPAMYVNTKTRKEFRVVRYTCTGKYNMDKYSMKVINSYIEELLALQHVSFYVSDAVMALLLWRGMFPIHSLSAFLIAISLVENPQMVPSFFFGSIAWVMLATQSYRSSLPDVWSRCRSFFELTKVLLLGVSRDGETISENENKDAANEYVASWNKRISDAEDAAKKAYDEQVAAQEEHEREMEEVGAADKDITSNGGGGISVDPFKAILFPVQQNLAMVCKYIRHVKHVLSWQECYIAYWVTVGSLILSVICMFVPWFFIIKWISRIVVWTIFGPWMKLVDVFYVSKIRPLTDEELADKKKAEKAQLKEARQAILTAARIKREDQTKLKAMKKYMFGKYIIRVPVLKEDRYRDLPVLESSSAVPYKPPRAAMSEIAMRDAGLHKIRVPGQHLVGSMIPRVDEASKVPIGQAISQPGLVDTRRVGGDAAKPSSSTLSSVVKLIGLVISAAILTYYGVPILNELTNRAMKYTQ